MTTRRPARIAIAAPVLAALVLSGCGGDDDTSGASTESTAATSSTVVSTTTTTPPSTTAAPTSTTEPAPTTYTIVAGDSLFSIAERVGVTLDELVAANGWPDGSAHLILPGDVIELPTGTTDAPPVDGDGAAQASYGPPPVDLSLSDDRTLPIVDPLVDGVYFSQDYTSDGSSVSFVLTQYFVCDSTTNVPEQPSVECVSGFGTLDVPTATATLAADASVTIVTGDLDDPTLAGVTADEFVRLAGGDVPGAGAPEGFEFSKALAFVQVENGEVVAVDQFYTS